MKSLMHVIHLGLVALVVTSGSLSWAQSPYSGYRPGTPTISPWMNLFNRNTGPLDNYHTYVQPQLETQRTFRDQNALNQRQQAALGALGKQMTRIEAEHEAPVSPTGTGSTFMNLSHYYPNSTGGGNVAKGAGNHQNTWKLPPPRSSDGGNF